MTKLSEGKYEVYFDMGSPGLMSKTVDAKNAKEAEKKVASGLHGKYKIKKVVKEDMKNTSKMMGAVRKGPKVGPWDIIVSKNNKIVKRVLVKNLKEIPAEMSDLRDKYPNHSIGIESKEGKIVYREGTCGYGIDGELGDEPAGPQLLKKKNESGPRCVRSTRRAAWRSSIAAPTRIAQTS